MDSGAVLGFVAVFVLLGIVACFLWMDGRGRTANYARSLLRPQPYDPLDPLNPLNVPLVESPIEHGNTVAQSSYAYESHHRPPVHSAHDSPQGRHSVHDVCDPTSQQHEPAHHTPDFTAHHSGYDFGSGDCSDHASGASDHSSSDYGSSSSDYGSGDYSSSSDTGHHHDG